MKCGCCQNYVFTALARDRVSLSCDSNGAPRGHQCRRALAVVHTASALARARQARRHTSVCARAGAGGVLGTDLIAKAAPDGYTLGMGNLAALSVNVSLMKKIPYDPLRDIAPVILIESSPLILTAGPSLRASTLKELIAQAKAEPGRLALKFFFL